MPSMSVAKLAAQFSSVDGIASAETLATTASMPPRCAADSRTQAASASPSATSTSAPCTSYPAPRSSFSAVRTPSADRAQNETVAPSAASASTTARPMPRLPPVTSAVRPLSWRSMGLLYVREVARARRSACSPSSGRRPGTSVLDTFVTAL